MQNFFETYEILDHVIAAGVSGGADSLALALRLHACGKKVIALTVDHGLRKESREEAEYVARIMAKYGIEHHILTWEGKKPLRGIEEAARQKRYELLFDWCKHHNVATLAVGHHRRDQAETFLLRLQRGSGVDGLSCMAPVSERDGIVLIRPQLYDSPDNLKDYLRQQDVQWVEDASNQCDDFLRVRIRKFLPELEKAIGLSEERLAETAAVLARTRGYVESQVAKFVKNNVRCWNDKVFSLSPEIFADQHEEIRYRVLAQFLQESGGSEYVPEAAALLRLCSEIDESSFKGATLGGCEVFKAAKRLWIVPEEKGGFVLKRQEWEKCLQDFPQYAKAKLPYKVRRALYLVLTKA